MTDATAAIGVCKRGGSDQTLIHCRRVGTRQAAYERTLSYQRRWKEQHCRPLSNTSRRENLRRAHEEYGTDGGLGRGRIGAEYRGLAVCHH